MYIFANGTGTQTLCVDSSVLGTKKKAKQSSFLCLEQSFPKARLTSFAVALDSSLFG